MLCDICHKNSATVHLTEIINDKIIEMHICQACAKSKTEELNEQLNMSDFLGGLVGVGEAKKEERLLKCSSCRLSYSEFKKKGKLGCNYCYVTFRRQLLSLLKKIHGSVRHIGKCPLHIDKKMPIEAKIKEVHERLERAIQLEEYEEAAGLRDEIKRLKRNKKTI